VIYKRVYTGNLLFNPKVEALAQVVEHYVNTGKYEKQLIARERVREMYDETVDKFMGTEPFHGIRMLKSRLKKLNLVDSESSESDL